jgi:hypothetical protein|tara:strand:+ start:811 stop:1104 length:294 start_codon:yes stop_codon:yes gene_type:complete
MEFILLLLRSVNEAKTQEEELMQERTMSQVKQLRIHEATEGKRRRANPEEGAQRKQQKCDIRKQKQQARLVHITHRSRASSKSTTGSDKHKTQELST